MATDQAVPSSANDFIEQQLSRQLCEIEDYFDAHAIALTGPLVFGVDNIVREVVAKRRGQGRAPKKLICILTTDGGYLEPVRRIVDVFRRRYTLVDFVIPDYAYSAGTILALSGDEIYMDYYSRLGPIDPQVEGRSGHMLPALGYIDRYEGLIEKARNGTITTAEVSLLIDGFDQAELYRYEQERDLSIALLEEWLAKYKFKNWRATRTRKLKVTPTMRKNRAAEIASELNNTRKWHTHDHGISREVLERDLNLIIQDFGAEPESRDLVRGYYNLLTDYMARLRDRGTVHACGDYRVYYG